MNSPELGAHEQHALRAVRDGERDVVLEQLAPRRRRGEPRRLVAGLDLGDQQLAIRLDQVVRAELELLRLAVDEG